MGALVSNYDYVPSHHSAVIEIQGKVAEPRERREMAIPTKAVGTHVNTHLNTPQRFYFWLECQLEFWYIKKFPQTRCQVNPCFKPPLSIAISLSNTAA